MSVEPSTSKYGDQSLKDTDTSYQKGEDDNKVW